MGFVRLELTFLEIARRRACAAEMLVLVGACTQDNAMPRSLFVGLGPRGDVSEAELRKAIEAVCPVVDVRIRGSCAFVDVATEEEGQRVIDKCSGTTINASRLSIQWSHSGKGSGPVPVRSELRRKRSRSRSSRRDRSRSRDRSRHDRKSSRRDRSRSRRRRSPSRD